MPSSPALSLTVSGTLRIETSRAVVIMAGAIVIVILLFLIVRAAAPVIAASMLATSVSTTGPDTSLYAGDASKYGFAAPGGD